MEFRSLSCCLIYIVHCRSLSRHWQTAFSLTTNLVRFNNITVRIPGYHVRFKSFPVREDRHFLVLCRYVEANAVRAGAVKDADNWQWGGHYSRRHVNKRLTLAAWPVDRPRNWLALLNDPLDAGELDGIRRSVNRGRPLGDAEWVEKTAKRLSLEFTLRPPGRPRKDGNQ
jgi:putative transposase